jgi:hypothetical protein
MRFVVNKIFRVCVKKVGRRVRGALCFETSFTDLDRHDTLVPQALRREDGAAAAQGIGSDLANAAFLPPIYSRGARS